MEPFNEYSREDKSLVISDEYNPIKNRTRNNVGKGIVLFRQNHPHYSGCRIFSLPDLPLPFPIFFSVKGKIRKYGMVHKMKKLKNTYLLKYNKIKPIIDGDSPIRESKDFDKEWQYYPE